MNGSITEEQFEESLTGNGAIYEPSGQSAAQRRLSFNQHAVSFIIAETDPQTAGVVIVGEEGRDVF